MTMLPEKDSITRYVLESEALRVGTKALSDGKTIQDALYAVYDHFRKVFLEERALMDQPVTYSHEAIAVLSDARELEAYVEHEWSKAIQGLDTPTYDR